MSGLVDRCNEQSSTRRCDLMYFSSVGSLLVTHVYRQENITHAQR